jgi:exonuclease SbcD
MRILHTSDWHIGRIWNQVDLLDVQCQFGKWLRDVVATEHIDAVLVAGDVFDTARPRAEAVSVADEIFTNLAAVRATIVVISGNHDSADGLRFGSRFMAGGGLHIRTERADLTALGAPITLTSSTGDSVEVVCLPFLEPNRVDLTAEQGDRTHENVLRVALEHQRTMVVDPSRTIVMAHAFVGGGKTSESERQLVSVGGTGMVNHRLFDGFGYVALGHLHRPHEQRGVLRLAHPLFVLRRAPKIGGHPRHDRHDLDRDANWRWTRCHHHQGKTQRLADWP